MTRFSPQKISTYESYTVDELSALVGMDKKTCFRWIDEGLPTVHGCQKPILILGKDAKDFIGKRNSKHKVKLKRNEFYCFTCRGPTRAKRGSIKVLDSRKTGVCAVCNGKIGRTIRPCQKDYHIPPAPVQMSIFNNNCSHH